VRADIIVIGAGPAGSACAITAAAAGLDVIIVDASPFPRMAPGETLHPGVESLFRKLGVADAVNAAGFPRHAGHIVNWDGDARFVPFGHDDSGPWHGYHAWRATLDALLLARANAVGARARLGCRAIEPLSDEGRRIIGVRTSGGSMRAPIVIDATGRRGWLSRCLNLPRRIASPRLLAAYGYVAAECGSEAQLVADRDGWTWTAAVRRDLVHWTRLDIGARTITRVPPLPVARQGAPLGRSRGANVTWRATNLTAGPGYFVTGDAAAVIDPASSHGVLNALLSGMLAGSLAADIIRRQIPERQAYSAYAAWMNDRFDVETRTLRELYLASPIRDRWLAAASS
jgi:flavin-dependent dehydrogenase